MRKAYIIVGLPATGRSTLARHIFETAAGEGLAVMILGRNEIRMDVMRESEEYFSWGEYSFAKFEPEVNRRFQAEKKEALEYGELLIFTDTNLNLYQREKLYEELEKNDFDVRYILLLPATPSLPKKINKLRSETEQLADDFFDDTAYRNMHKNFFDFFGEVSRNAIDAQCIVLPIMEHEEHIMFPAISHKEIMS